MKGGGWKGCVGAFGVLEALYMGKPLPVGGWGEDNDPEGALVRQDHSAVGRRRVATGTAGAKDPSAERVGRRREARLLRMRLLRQARMENSSLFPDEFCSPDGAASAAPPEDRSPAVRLLTRTEGFHPRQGSLIWRRL